MPFPPEDGDGELPGWYVLLVIVVMAVLGVLSALIFV